MKKFWFFAILFWMKFVFLKKMVDEALLVILPESDFQITQNPVKTRNSTYCHILLPTLSHWWIFVILLFFLSSYASCSYFISNFISDFRVMTSFIYKECDQKFGNRKVHLDFNQYLGIGPSNQTQVWYVHAPWIS